MRQIFDFLDHCPEFGILVLEISSCSIPAARPFGCFRHQWEDSGVSLAGVARHLLASQAEAATTLSHPLPRPEWWLCSWRPDVLWPDGQREKKGERGGWMKGWAVRQARLPAKQCRAKESQRRAFGKAWSDYIWSLEVLFCRERISLKMFPFLWRKSKRVICTSLYHATPVGGCFLKSSFYIAVISILPSVVMALKFAMLFG